MITYDFIEIGTSDFDTCIQQVTDQNVVGACIDPVKMYLNRLPNFPNVTKHICALTNNKSFVRSTTNVFYVHPDTIEKYGLPNWLRGCNSIGRMHLQHENIIQHVEYEEIEVVDAGFFFETVLQPKRIRYLKIDTEGHDCIILKSLYCFFEKSTTARPQIIKFGSNELTPKSHVRRVIAQYAELGYGAQKKNDDTVMTLEFGD